VNADRNDRLPILWKNRTGAHQPFACVAEHAKQAFLLNGMMFRQNRREVEEGDRVNLMLSATHGKRLRYKELIA